MERAKIIVKGDVQRVGYRDIVEQIARKLKLVGYVENLKPYDVEIVAEGEKDQIEEFMKGIRVKKWPIEVTDLEVTYEEPTSEFEYFEIRRGDWKDELGERLDTAGKYLYKSVVLGEKSVAIGEKMLEKQDETIKVLGEKIDNVGDKVDAVGSKVDAVGSKVDAVGSKVDAVGSKVDALRDETKQDFGMMDTKYDKISDKMDSIDNTLKELTKAILALVEKKS